MKEQQKADGAVIVLHEIYGTNQFMHEICKKYKEQGFDVVCPDLFKGKVFDYTDASYAYEYFMKEVGFGHFEQIQELARTLKKTYRHVFISGFSVGATIGWRCAGTQEIDGIICHYGSRIRDFLSLTPVCPVLLLFADEKAFDVHAVADIIQRKANCEVHVLKGFHGFMDRFGPFFDQESKEQADKYAMDFIQRKVREKC